MMKETTRYIITAEDEIKEYTTKFPPLSPDGAQVIGRAVVVSYATKAEAQQALQKGLEKRIKKNKQQVKKYEACLARLKQELMESAGRERDVQNVAVTFTGGEQRSPIKAVVNLIPAEQKPPMKVRVKFIPPEKAKGAAAGE